MTYFKKTSIIILVVSLLVAIIAPAKPTSAAAVTGFKAGNIMSNYVFTKKNSMSVSRIQNFLDSKVPSCDKWGNKTSEYGGGSRAQFGTSQGYPPPYTCLKNYSQGGQSAARIIYNAAQDYSINPQVLIVLLQKEQGLVTDDWPWSIQYRSATGYGCPDSADCDSDYYGFKNQVRQAARMFRNILNENPNWYTPYGLGNNQIYWHPDTSRCGSSTVNIQNLTTVALYSYTPYRPNSAALNAGYGTGNSCSSYGNRNFYQYFKDWFGNPRATQTFISLTDPRWMQLSTDTYKTSIESGAEFGPLLDEGLHVYFPDKYYSDGEWYLRTQWDKNNGNKDGIALSDLDEIPIVSISSQWLSINSGARKIDPIREKSYEKISGKTAVKVVDSVTVNGSLYYRTEWENNSGRSRFIASGQLESFRFYDFTKPRVLRTKKDTMKVNVKNGSVIASVSKNSYFYFDKKITVDGTLYAQISDDHGTNYAIRFSDLDEIDKLPFVSLDNPRTMQLSSDTYKNHLPLGGNFGPELLAGREIYFPDKLKVNGIWYLRTQWDKNHGNQDGIPLSELEEL